MYYQNFLKRFLFLPVALFGFTSSIHAYVPMPVKADSPKEKYLQTIDFVANMAKDIYCYWDIKKEQHQVNWEAIINKAKSEVNDETTFEQFQQVLTRIASSVHDGHVNYIPNSLNRLFYTPIRIKMLPGGYYVAQVKEDKMWPYPVDIEPGDKLLAVNGTPIDAYIEGKGKMMSASTNYSLKSYAALALPTLEKFVDAPEENLKLTIEKHTSKRIKTVELSWINYPNRSLEDSKLSDQFYSKILPGNIGVLTLGEMYHKNGKGASIAYIKQQMASLKNTKALIIDVRNNGGGWGEIGDSVIAHFITKKVRRYKAQLKNSYQAIYARPGLVEIFGQTDPSLYEYSEWEDYDIEPLAQEKAVYDKPVYVLTNELCFSACDTFVDSFSSNHIGKVLGAQTGGGTGYPLWFELPWEFGNFRFSILRGYSNHGRYLEGIGTIPDEEMYATPHDLYHHLDGELIKAYDYVMNDLNQTKHVLYAQNENETELELNFALKEKEIVPYHLEEAFWQKVQK